MRDLCATADWCRQRFPNENKYLFATSFGGYISLLCSRDLEDFSIVLRAPAVTMGEHILTDLLQITPEEWKERGSVVCGFERRIDLPYRFYEELRLHSLSDRECDPPLLILHGDADDVVPCEDVAAFCASHANAKLQMIRGADHRFNKPGELDQVVGLTLAYWGI